MVIVVLDGVVDIVNVNVIVNSISCHVKCQESVPTVTTTLQDVWDSLDPPLAGITASPNPAEDQTTPNITATIFMASQGGRVCDY